MEKKYHHNIDLDFQGEIVNFRVHNMTTPTRQGIASILNEGHKGLHLFNTDLGMPEWWDGGKFVSLGDFMPKADVDFSNYYTKFTLDAIFMGDYAMTGYNKANWDGAFSWTNAFPAMGGGTAGRFLTNNGSAMAWGDVPKLASITLNTPGLLYSGPVAFSEVNGGWAGTLQLKEQTSNLVLAGPETGIAAPPTFRYLTTADIPGLPASKITTGTIDAARLDLSAYVRLSPNAAQTGGIWINGTLRAATLATGSTAPASAGTIYNVTTDANGQLSFSPNLLIGDYNGTTGGIFMSNGSPAITYHGTTKILGLGSNVYRHNAGSTERNIVTIGTNVGSTITSLSGATTGTATLIGTNVMNNITYMVNNIAVGNNIFTSTNNLSSGYPTNNTLIGQNIFNNTSTTNQTLTSNIAIGVTIAPHATSSSQNVFVGGNILSTVASGTQTLNRNVIVGGFFSSTYGGVTMEDNVYVGIGSAEFVSGSRHTFVGGAGGGHHCSTASTNNTTLGYGAFVGLTTGAYPTYTYATAIGSGTQAKTSNSVYLGREGLDNVYAGNLLVLRNSVTQPTGVAGGVYVYTGASPNRAQVFLGGVWKNIVTDGDSLSTLVMSGPFRLPFWDVSANGGTYANYPIQSAGYLFYDSGPNERFMANVKGTWYQIPMIAPGPAPWIAASPTEAQAANINITGTVTTAGRSVFNGGLTAFGGGQGLGESTFSSTTTALLLRQSGTAWAANQGPTIMFYGNITDTTGRNFAGLSGRKEDATSGGRRGYLQFSVSNGSGDLVEIGRFSSYGTLKITNSLQLGTALATGTPLENGMVYYDGTTHRATLRANGVWRTLLMDGESGGSYTLPTASNSVLGGIKIGSGLNIDAGGIASVTLPLASAIQVGGIMLGNGLQYDNSSRVEVAYPWLRAERFKLVSAPEEDGLWVDKGNFVVPDDNLIHWVHVTISANPPGDSHVFQERKLIVRRAGGTIAIHSDIETMPKTSWDIMFADYGQDSMGGCEVSFAPSATGLTIRTKSTGYYTDWTITLILF